MKFILLSGPPSAGKDTAGMILKDLYGWPLEKFAAPMKAAIPALLDRSFEELEKTKELSITLEDGTILPSFRKLQQDMSERYMKELYGEDIFAKLLAHRVLRESSRAFRTSGPVDTNIWVITDCGFQIEVDMLAGTFGPENCFLINLSREGTSYCGDTRERVNPVPGMAYKTIFNDSSKEVLGVALCVSIHDWLTAGISK